MIVTYDPYLITLSVLIAVVGSYTGLRLARRLQAKRGAARKALLSAAALAIGSGIWSMHFVGMLALELPVTIDYDVLLTLISVLLAILVTGIGLHIASFGEATTPKLAAAGTFMGLGISTMHYVGMAAVRANCVIDYSSPLVAASVLVGIGASILALWLGFNLKGRNNALAAAAVVMGLAISGMHYTAMAAATFLPVDVLLTFSAPVLGPHLLAIVVAVATFLIFGVTLLIALPGDPKEQQSASENVTMEDDLMTSPVDIEQDHRLEAATIAFDRHTRIPVERNKKVVFLDPHEVHSIQAEAHHSRVSDGRTIYFCSLSLSELEGRLDSSRFMRVHRSHIINLEYARTFERQKAHGVVSLGGESDSRIPVSRRNIPKLRAALGLP